MNPIKKIYDERKKEFEKEFIHKSEDGDGGGGGGEVWYWSDSNYPRINILDSQKSDILAVIEGLEKWFATNIQNISDKECLICKKTFEEKVIYNCAYSNILQLLKEAKKEINQDK